jgi:hypothetical protein
MNPLADLAYTPGPGQHRGCPYWEQGFTSLALTAGRWSNPPCYLYQEIHSFDENNEPRT